MSKRKMKDSGVEWLGEIPAEWDVTALSQQVSQVKCKNDNLVEKNLLSLSYGKIKRRDIDTVGGLLPASFEGYNRVESGDIVLRLTDLQNDQHSLRTGLVKENGIVTSAYVSVRPCSRSSSEYLHFALYAFDVAKGFYGMGSGVRQGLTYGDVKQLRLPYPPLDTQRKIAAYLDGRCAKIDEMVSDAKKTIEEYKAWKASVIFESVTGKNTGAKMKDSGVDWIGMVPSGWEIVPLRRLGSCVNGISKGGEFFGSGYPFVSYSDVYKNDWLPASVKGLVESTPEERKHYSVREGDVFFTRTSETVDELGMAGACLKTIPDAVFAGFLIRFRPDTTELAVEYYKYYFRNVSLRNFFTKETMLVTRASLSQDLLRSMMVVVPPRSEQIAIARFLDKKCAAIDRVISEKESLIADLESYKKSLIFECVTGKMEVA